MKFGDNEVISTIYLEGKDLNSIDSMFEIIDKSNFMKEKKIKNIRDDFEYLTMRKENDKLVFQFKYKIGVITEILDKYFLNAKSLDFHQLNNFSF